MNQLGKGLNDAGHDGYALIVKEAELAIHRRLGAPESHLLTVQANLACTLDELGRYEEALPMKRDVHSGHARLFGEEASITLISANNYASCLVKLKRFEEAKALLRKTILVARRVSGNDHENTLRLRWHYAKALYEDDGATVADLRKAVETDGGLKDRAARARGRASGHRAGGMPGRRSDAPRPLRLRRTRRDDAAGTAQQPPSRHGGDLGDRRHRAQKCPGRRQSRRAGRVRRRRRGCAAWRRTAAS